MLLKSCDGDEHAQKCQCAAAPFCREPRLSRGEFSPAWTVARAGPLNIMRVGLREQMLDEYSAFRNGLAVIDTIIRVGLVVVGRVLHGHITLIEV